MPLLKNKMQEKEVEKQAIEARINRAPLNPTDDEAQIVKEISEKIAARFRDEISENGFTDGIKEKIRVAIVENAEQLDIDYEIQKRIE